MKHKQHETVVLIKKTPQKQSVLNNFMKNLTKTIIFFTAINTDERKYHKQLFSG